MFSVIRANLELMDEVRTIINSNFDLYEPIVEEKDLSQHDVTRKWAERNFKIREFYLGREAGKFVAMSSYQSLGDDLAYVGYFYVKKKHQRNGYGRAMMEFLKLRAKQDGVTKLTLFVQPKANWALRFYEKTGFSMLSKEKDEIISLHDGVYRPFYEENSYLLEKTIKKIDQKKD